MAPTHRIGSRFLARYSRPFVGRGVISSANTGESCTISLSSWDLEFLGGSEAAGPLFEIRVLRRDCESMDREPDSPSKPSDCPYACSWAGEWPIVPRARISVRNLLISRARCPGYFDLCRRNRPLRSGEPFFADFITENSTPAPPYQWRTTVGTLPG
jgi:hypothetical protein